MHSNTTGLHSVAGHYVLYAYERATERFVERYFPTLEALAQALQQAYRPCPRWAGDEGAAAPYVVAWAYSRRGRELDVAALVSYGVRLEERERLLRYSRAVPGYVRRRGAVWGVRKCRGGRSQQPLTHINERRAAALVLVEDGEVAPRASRNCRTLPDPRDEGRWRNPPRCWKSQHKGRKAWDRARQ